MASRSAAGRTKKKRPVGRPRTGARPVIAMRIEPDTYAMIEAAAARSGRSIAGEAADRLRRARKRGRPAKFLTPRVSLSFRLSRPIYDQIKEVAAANGRSISEEIERRIEMPATMEQAVTAVLGGMRDWFAAERSK